MHLKEDIIKAINDISEEQMQRLSDWLQNLKRERAKPPQGFLFCDRVYIRKLGCINSLQPT